MSVAPRDEEALKAARVNYTAHMYEGVNHGFPAGHGTGKIISWLTKRKREPYPKKVIWEPGNPEKRLFFWLRLASPNSASSNSPLRLWK